MQARSLMSAVCLTRTLNSPEGIFFRPGRLSGLKVECKS
jgi:hypothetical protein